METTEVKEVKNFGFSNLEIALVYKMFKAGADHWYKGREKSMKLLKIAELMAEAAGSDLSEENAAMIEKMKKRADKMPKLLISSNSILDKLNSVYSSIIEADPEIAEAVEEMIPSEA